LKEEGDKEVSSPMRKKPQNAVVQTARRVRPENVEGLKRGCLKMREKTEV